MGKLKILELNLEADAFISETEQHIDGDLTVVVPPSCEAVFVKNGEILGVFGEGSRKLSKNNSIFTRLILRRVDPVCRVYCVNKTVPILGYWGTPSRFEFLEPETGMPIAVGLCGSYKLKIADSAKALKNLLGLKKSLDAEAVAQYFGSEIAAVVRDNMFKIVTENETPFFSLAGDLKTLSALVREQIDTILDAYGLVAVSFTVDSVALDDEIRELVRNCAKHAYIRKKTAEERREAIEKEVKAAEREREENIRKHAVELARAGAAQQRNEKNTDESYCPECGKHIAKCAKFCPECGASLMAKCTCGRKWHANEKFCRDCGRKFLAGEGIDDEKK